MLIISSAIVGVLAHIVTDWKNFSSSPNTMLAEAKDAMTGEAVVDEVEVQGKEGAVEVLEGK